MLFDLVIPDGCVVDVMTDWVLETVADGLVELMMAGALHEVVGVHGLTEVFVMGRLVAASVGFSPLDVTVGSVSDGNTG